MKRIILYALFAFLCILFLIGLVNYGALLYFGTATITTTILFYILIFLAGIGLIFFLNRFLKCNIVPNLTVLFVAIWAGLLIGELSLRFIFKQNLTFTERIGDDYHSCYSYTENWGAIKNYILKRKNFWYLHGSPNTVRIFNIDGHKIYHQYNPIGFRDKEILPDMEDSIDLIIGLGDSFTEGVGTDQDSTWLKFFERDMNACSGKKIKTLNAGASGSDPYFEYILLEKILQQYHPNTVILAINSSDIDDIIIKGGRERFRPGGRLQFRKPPAWEPLYATSFIFRSIMHSTKNLDWTLLTEEEKAIKSKQAIDSIDDCIKQFHTLSKIKGFKLVVIFHPREVEIRTGNFPLDGLASKLITDTSYNVINLKNEYILSGRITTENSSNYYWQTDLHHNTNGYKVWGDILAKYIAKKDYKCDSVQPVFLKAKP